MFKIKKLVGCCGLGLISWGFPRLLVAFGVPLEKWITELAGTMNMVVSSDAAIWAATVILGAVLLIVFFSWRVFEGDFLKIKNHQASSTSQPVISSHKNFVISAITPEHAFESNERGENNSIFNLKARITNNSEKMINNLNVKVNKLYPIGINSLPEYALDAMGSTFYGLPKVISKSDHINPADSIDYTLAKYIIPKHGERYVEFFGHRLPPYNSAKDENGNYLNDYLVEVQASSENSIPEKECLIIRISENGSVLMKKNLYEEITK